MKHHKTILRTLVYIKNIWIHKMRKIVKIADKIIGDGYPCFITAEIGINHNGSVQQAMALIDMAVSVGCDAV